MEDAVDGGEGGQGVLPVMEHDHEVLESYEYDVVLKTVIWMKLGSGDG